MSSYRQRLTRVERLERAFLKPSGTHCGICGRPFRPWLASWAQVVRWALNDSPGAFCLDHDPQLEEREAVESKWREAVDSPKSRNGTNP